MGIHPQRRILFVDQDSNRWQQIDHHLSSSRPQWQWEVTTSPEEALLRMAQQPYDAVVAAAPMPGMTARHLMHQARELYPRISLLVRGEQDDPNWIKDFGTRMPLFIPPEADGKALAEGLDRAFKPKIWERDPAVMALFDKLREFPALPSLYRQVVEELESPRGSIELVGWRISQEPMMTAKILQTVNSGLFCLPQQFTDPAEAVLFLGAECTKSLILLSKLFCQFDNNPSAVFSLDRLWQHSIVVGSFARFITLAESQNSDLADQAYTAGLLHDIGKVLLAGNLPKEYEEVLALQNRKGIPAYLAEKSVLGTTHARLGGCLLDHWGLPSEVVTAVASHHWPSNSGQIGFSLLAAVHAANGLSYRTKEVEGQAVDSEVDYSYLSRCGLRESYQTWGQLCGLAPTYQEN